MNIESLLETTPVIPVLTIPDAAHAADLARALALGGLQVLEVTLRSADALESIRRIATEVPEVTVGAGTLTHPEDFDRVIEAGGRFGVSPGLTPKLADAAAQSGLPFLPGIMTAGEALVAREHGYTVQKLFPANVAGGMSMLKALSGPLPDLRFCPTGGLNAENFRDYLALPNVICVGGSWVAPWSAVTSRDWDRISQLAQQTTEGGAAS